MRSFTMINVAVVSALATSAMSSPACRDQNLWPFASTSIWNTPIGSNALFSPAHIFSPQGNVTPSNFFSDDDFFFTSSTSDPLVPWYNQGYWGPPYEHCNVTGNFVQNIHFPYNVTVTQGGNNALALLSPDNDTLILTQPFYRCQQGGPFLSLLDKWHGTTSIRGNGSYGGHGGSSLSAIGGTIRKGELLLVNDVLPVIRHALKLELFAHEYYYGHAPGYIWPALNCDGYAFNCTMDAHGCYGGTNILLSPGSLLAIPTNVSQTINASLLTPPGKILLQALTDFGGYLVDDTYANRGTICTEHGVTDEFQAAYNYSFNAIPTGPSASFYKDMLLLFQNLQIVTNNGPENVGGGGTPLTSLAPPFC